MSKTAYLIVKYNFPLLKLDVQDLSLSISVHLLPASQPTGQKVTQSKAKLVFVFVSQTELGTLYIYTKYTCTYSINRIVAIIYSQCAEYFTNRTGRLI